jgi:hypothetical protein
VLAPDKNVPPLTSDSAKTDAPNKTDAPDKTVPSDKTNPSDTTAPRDNTPTPVRTRDARTSVPPPASRSRAGGFYAEVEDAIDASGGGRVVEFEGDTAAPGASGAARAAYQRGSAYVRANFRGLPLPSAVGAGVYVLWGVLTDGRIVYMGSLPATEDLNRAEVYAQRTRASSSNKRAPQTLEGARAERAHAPFHPARVRQPNLGRYKIGDK